MEITSPAPAVSAAPRHAADLRPAADAAALSRDPRPILPLGPALVSQPPQTAQVAAVSRALLDTSDTSRFPPIKAPERVLKPWGVQMLPYQGHDERPGEAEPGKDEDAAADAGSAPVDPNHGCRDSDRGSEAA